VDRGQWIAKARKAFLVPSPPSSGERVRMRRPRVVTSTFKNLLDAEKYEAFVALKGEK
jgi:hypothetical protein